MPTMSDAAQFRPEMLAGFDAVAGYIGGEDVAHTWSDTDWANTGVKPKLPIWVPSPNATETEARSTDLWAILNIILHYRMARGTTIAFDLETSKADVSYIQGIAGYLQFFGYGSMVYGSKSTIASQAPSYIWRWDADWTGSPHLNPGSQATQWTNGNTWDSSEISSELLGTLWR